jgi:hypothetical protein
MHKQVFALTAGLKAQYFIDLKVFWLAAVLGAAKGRWKQARETLKIERLRARCLIVRCLRVRRLRTEGLRVDNI